MIVHLEHRGVASVLGTLFFVVVFMIALGSLAYASSLQSQSSQAEQQALQIDAQRASEDVLFTNGPSGLAMTDTGPSSVVTNHVVLKYPNGTFYLLQGQAVVAAGARESVQALVPSGVCSPGTATCLSKYEQIVEGNPPGSLVGVVTSLGNTFWYQSPGGEVNWSSLFGFPGACPAGESITQLNITLTCASTGEMSSWAKEPVVTTGVGSYDSTSLSVPLPPGHSYAFFAFTAVEPSFGTEKYNFEVHSLPSGASLVIACAPLSYPAGGGNEATNCVSAPSTPIAASNALGFGVSPPVYATPGLFGVVTTGTTGALLQIDFACTYSCGSITLEAGSFMVVQPIG